MRYTHKLYRSVQFSGDDIRKHGLQHEYNIFFATKIFINLQICSGFISFSRVVRIPTPFHRCARMLYIYYTGENAGVLFDKRTRISVICISSKAFVFLPIQKLCNIEDATIFALPLFLLSQTCSILPFWLLMLGLLLFCNTKIIYATRRKQLVVCVGVIRNARFNLCLS